MKIFVERRANNLTKNSQKIFFKKKQVISSRNMYEPQKNPIIYLTAEPVYSQGILQYIKRQLETPNYQKDYEIINRNIKQIEFNQVDTQEISNQQGNNSQLLSEYPKQRKNRQKKYLLQKQLCNHLMDIINYYANLYIYKNPHNNGKYFSQGGIWNLFLNQIYQQYQNEKQKWTSNEFFVTRNFTKYEKVMKSIKENFKQLIQYFSNQIFDMENLKVKKEVDCNHQLKKQHSKIFQITQLKTAIELLFFQTKKVELSKIVIKCMLEEIQENELQVSQNYQNFQKQTFEEESLLIKKVKLNKIQIQNKFFYYIFKQNFQETNDNFSKISEQKREKQYKIESEKSSMKGMGINTKIIFKHLDSQKFKKQKVQKSKPLKKSQTELDIQINLQNQLIKVSFSQAQKRHLQNLFLQNQITKFNKQQSHLLSKQQKQIQLSSINEQNIWLNINNSSKQQLDYHIQKDKLFGGGIFGSKSKSGTQNTIIKKEQQIKQIIDGKEQLKKEFEILSEEEKLKAEQSRFQKFNLSYNEYFKTEEVSISEIETDVRQIIENTLFNYREQIVQPEIRHKVIDMINLLINYLLIIKQKNSKQSIQSDINSIADKLQTLIIYCKENKERLPCLDLYQYFDILKTLNSQRTGLGVANQNIAIQIIKKVVQVAKFGAGFVSIAGAIKNLTDIDLNKVNIFINEIKQIVKQITSESSTEAIKIGLDGYSDYNTNNIACNMQALWLKKVQYLGESISENDYIQEIIFYLEESPKITNKDSQIFVYMQLNYLLSKQQMEDNFDQLTKRLDKLKKRNLIIQLSNILQFKEYSDGIIDKIKNIASLIAQSNQFRYIKAQLLFYFAQILKNSDKNEFTEIMTSIVSNYMQEKQSSVKIIYKRNQIMADFIHNHLDKGLILTQISEFKNQITKNLDDKQQYNDFAYDIQNEKDLDKQLAKYFVEMWKQSVKQRQKKLELTHKDDALLEAIHLYVNQQITYQEGLKIKTEENDAVKLIIDQFLLPNYVFSSDEIHEIKPNQQNNLEESNQSSCKIISILAEGGSGKSMFLKKLEVELLSRDSEYTKDNRSDFIPFIIKCNSLDKEKPSIENYLESVNIKRKDIDLLKKSERNKLIMLDGYDEYTGDYFKVYEKLKLNEWVNTLVIVTSRLEKITVSDAKVYFNYYDNQGSQGQSNSFSIFKLEKITTSDIEEYLQKYKQQVKSQTTNFNPQQHDKLKEIIFKNKLLTELLKLPINLYLTTRMIADIDLSDESTSKAFGEVQDQIDIQELFFSQQFNKQSQIFVKQQNGLNLNQKQTEEFIQNISACYFEYFQSIAMHMFTQKGKKSNYLSTNRDSIKYQPREDISAILKKNKIKVDDLILKLNSFVDSRVITRIQLKLDADNSKSHSDKQQADDYQQQEFEFRHKSIFEYFAARAMKYDFDLHKEDIFKLEISKLKQFNINKRIIMSSERNESEQQILIKLYKLIKPYLDSQFFMQTYTKEELSKTNKYIQFLKKSTISKYTEKSEIDIGASNLLSALFLSNFLYPQLVFEKCSFSQAYISPHISRLSFFQECNLNESLIEKQKLENYATSNTQNAIFGGLYKQFDLSDTYTFQQVIFYKNTLVSITQTGYINQFEILQNDNQQSKLVLQNKITSLPLESIHLITTKNIFVVRTNKTLLEIDAQTFEIVNSFTFILKIQSIAINNSKYFIILSDNQIFYGDIQNGFTLLDKSKIKGQQAIAIKDFIIISDEIEGVNVYNSQNLKFIKKIQDDSADLNLSAFSQNGKYFATLKSIDCQIWDFEKGFELIKTIKGHDKLIISISFSSNGKYFITGSFDQTCKVWNSENEFKLETTINGFYEHVLSTTFSTEGMYLAIILYDNDCRIYDIERKFQHILSIKGHRDSISSVAYSTDGNYFASGSRDQTCKIWSVKKGYQLIKTIEHESSISSIAFSADGRYLATGSDDSACKIWDIQKGFQLLNVIQVHKSLILSLAFSANTKYLATGCSNGICKVWDIVKGFEIITTINGQSQGIYSVAFSADNKYLVTGLYDGTCKIWEIEEGFELIQHINGQKNFIQLVCFVAFSSDFKYLAVGVQGYACQIFDVTKGFELIKDIENHKQSFCTIAFSPNSKYLATGCSNKLCKIWNVDKGFELINTIEAQDSKIYSVAFSPDSKFLSTGYSNNFFKIWNVEKGFETISIAKNHKDSISSIAFSSNLKFMATSSVDNTCKVWNVEKGFDLIYTIEDHKAGFCSVAFSPDNKYLSTSSRNAVCKIWNIQKGFELINTLQGHTKQINSVSFSADGKYFVTCSSDLTYKIWNIQMGFQLLNTIKGHTKGIYSIAFSSNSKFLATGSDDNTCKIWDNEKEFQLIKTIQGHYYQIYSVTFSADSKYLATVSSDVCKIWKVENEFELLNKIGSNYHSIVSISFSADSKYLASCSRSSFCQIWDIEKGFQLIKQLQDFHFEMSSVAFSVDGKYLATGLAKNTCKIWDVESLFEYNKVAIENNEINQDTSKLNKTQNKITKLMKTEKNFQQLYQI